MTDAVTVSDEKLAEPVAWQWQQCVSRQPGVWPTGNGWWNTIVELPGQDKVKYWKDLAAKLPDEVRVRPLFASPTSPTEVKALREALKPFAAEAASWSDQWSDDFVPVLTPSVMDEADNERARFTVGDLRRARSVLTEANHGK